MIKVKTWICLTCPVCSFRFPLRKFNKSKPIDYPAQIVSGGGRAKGFKVLKYMSWATLPTLRHTDAFPSILNMYAKLGTAYDHFYEVFGFLSPQIRALLSASQKPYTHAYPANRFSEYSRTYASEKTLNIGEPYSGEDYSKVFQQLSV